MNPTSALAPVPKAEARPIEATERLPLVDALRGFALCGVFLSNVFVWFNGRAFLSRAQAEALLASASSVEVATLHTFMVLVFGKFITLFSFLFGLGFSLQMGRAEARGASIVPLYARRLAVLLLIGLTHLFALWYGDILSTYAVLGFGLLLFRNRSDRTLWVWAAVFILLVPLLSASFFRLLPLLTAASPEAAAAAAKEATQRSAQIKAQTLQVFTSGTYLEVVRANASYYFSGFLKPLLGMVLALLGRFLLGLLAGRHRLFHEVPRHLPFFRKLLGWSLVAGVLGSGVGQVVRYLILQKLLEADLPWMALAMTVVRQVGELGLAAFYLAAFVLLFQRPLWQRLLSVLAPVGRMALTNYLTQTGVSLLLFYGYGLGLMGQVRPLECIALTLGLFAVQVGVSHLWLARFRFGPAEWVWRSLTYGKAWPMRRAPEPTVETPVPA
jgi:uncharacterized protein